MSGPGGNLSANPRLTIALVFLCFVAAGLLLVSNVGVFGWAVLTAIMAGAILIGRPRAVLMIYWALVMIYPYISSLYPSEMIKWSDEILIVIMFAILFMHYLYDRSIFDKVRGVNRSVLALLFLIFISTLVNQVPKPLVLHFVLQYMRMFLLFYFAYLFLQPRHLRGFTVTMLSVVFLEYILNFGWFFGRNPLPNWMSGQDIAIGTGLGANVCAYYSVAAIFILLQYSMMSGTTGRKLLAWTLIVLSLAHLYITYTFHAYIMLAVIAAAYGLLRFRAYGTRLIVPGVGLLVLALCVLALLPTRYVEPFKMELAPDRLVERFENIIDGPKGVSYTMNVTQLPRDIPYPVFGGGPGNAGSMVARINHRPLANEYFMWVDESVERFELSSGASILGGPCTGLLTLWSELGPVGFLVYWGFHLAAIVHVVRGLAAGRYSNRYQRILAEAFIPVMLMFIMLSALSDYSYMAHMTVLWIWAGAVWRQDGDTATAPETKEALVATPRRRLTYGW